MQYNNLTRDTLIFKPNIKSISDERRVAALETKFKNIGASLVDACRSILQSTNGEYKCCANEETGRLFCIRSESAREFRLGSSTVCLSTPHVCSYTAGIHPGDDIKSRQATLWTKSTNVVNSLENLCQIAKCHYSPVRDFGIELDTLEARAKNAAKSLEQSCQGIEELAEGNLRCCSNSENGKMVCIRSIFAAAAGIDDNGIGVCDSTDAPCN